MPLGLDPAAVLNVTYLAAADDYQESPLIGWHTVAEVMNDESGTAIDGRYAEGPDELQGYSNLKMQDTYIFGTGGLTGRAFDVTSGDATDGWVHPEFNKHGILMPNGYDGQSAEIVDHVATDGLSHQEVIIGRGLSAPTVVRGPDTIYCRLEIAYGADEGNYRICIDWHAPIRLEWKGPDDADWQTVAIARRLGSAQSYLKHNNGEVRLGIHPDPDRGRLWVEVGDGHWLKHSPPRPNTDDPRARLGRAANLPSTERYRLTIKNGWAYLMVLPFRYQALTVKKSKRQYRDAIANLQDAQVLSNSLGEQSSDQTQTATVSQDADNALEWTATAEKPDAGDGLGSADPPTFADVQVIIPPVWSSVMPWIWVPVAQPPVMAWEELQVFDSVTRTTSFTADFTIYNGDGSFTGNFGNYAMTLLGTNGYTWAQRMRGMIAGGFTTFRQDPTRLMKCVAHDLGYMLDRPMGVELVVDGWCLYSAVHAVLDAGQISPRFRQRIPWYRYGPADYDCPYPILGRGTGDSPAWRFDPQQTCISALLELVQDAGIEHPVTGANVPFYTGMDFLGNWNFEPFDPRYLPIQKWYSDTDPTGANQIEEIEVYTSIEQLRSSIDFFGQDPWTGELLYEHLPLPWNLPYIGYNYPWIERQQRWCSQDYLQRLMTSAAVMASLGTTIVRIKTMYDPFVNAGQLAYISERQALGRQMLGVIENVHSRCGLRDCTGVEGYRDCYSWVTLRDATNLVPW